MQLVKRLLLCLDLSEIDTHLLQYTVFISSITEVEEVDIVYVVENIKKTLVRLEEPADAADAEVVILRKLNDTVSPFLTDFARENIKVQAMLAFGTPRTEINKLVQSRDINLVALGRKNGRGADMLPRQLIRSTPCSVLCIPSNPPLQIQRALLPLDDSKYTNYALDRALLLAKLQPMRLICQHTYTIPNGYHTSGKSREEYGNVMKGHAEKRHAAFMYKNRDKYNPEDFEVLFELCDGTTRAHTIHQTALIQRADIILIGARSRAQSAAAILSCTAEKLCSLDVSIPLVVIKDRSKAMSFFEALLNL